MLPIFIIDFDSTFITVEALDELAKIALNKNPQKEKISKQIADITKAGMEGLIDFETSLSQRFALFQPTNQDLNILIQSLKKSVTASILRNKDFFKNNKNNLYIISGGFIEYIEPIVKEFGIEKSHILANSFIYDDQKNIIGYDKNNLLSNKDGKTNAVKKLNLTGEIIVIGDGYTDYEIKKNGAAKKFFAFTENINRGVVANLADDVMFNFDELLYLYGNTTQTFEKKIGPQVLMLGQQHQAVVSQFEQEGFIVKIEEIIPSEKKLIKLLKDATVLIAEPTTQIDLRLLEKTEKLLVIGRCGQTTGQINLEACTKKGIAVFNAPYTNIRSVAELVLADIIMLFRRTFEKSSELKNGLWDKTSFQSNEIKGKKLGIIGYNAAGAQLSLLAEALGMQVYFYDKEERASLGNAKACDSIEELLRISDAISIHLQESQKTDYPLTIKEFSLMKDGVIFINLSSGYIIDERLLAQQLRNNKLGGVAIDVFGKEPKLTKSRFNSPLQNFTNVILTPHIGGLTEEAMTASGNFVAQKVLRYLANGTTTGSANFPQITLLDKPDTHRFLHIHINTPGILANINNIMSKNHANIEEQYLKTNEQIGYVITDVTTDKPQILIKNLQKIPGTIRVREVY